MMYRFTIIGGKFFLMTIIDGDVMLYLGSRALTKKWSDNFSKPFA